MGKCYDHFSKYALGTNFVAKVFMPYFCKKFSKLLSSHPSGVILVSSYFYLEIIFKVGVAYLKMLT